MKAMVDSKVTHIIACVVLNFADMKMSFHILNTCEVSSLGAWSLYDHPDHGHSDNPYGNIDIGVYHQNCKSFLDNLIHEYWSCSCSVKIHKLEMRGRGAHKKVGVEILLYPINTSCSSYDIQNVNGQSKKNEKGAVKREKTNQKTYSTPCSNNQEYIKLLVKPLREIIKT